MKKGIQFKQKLILLISIFAVVSVILLFIAFKPFHLKGQLNANPTMNYNDSLARIERIWEAEAENKDLNQACGTILMSHNKKVDNLIVLLHGFTSCPVQFVELGQAFFNEGYNVYIPLQPQHGLRDVKGTALKGITAEDLAAFGTETADIAQGLGDRVIVVGLSGGGSLATWLGQARKDIDLIVPIAPFLGINYVPRILTRPVTNLILAIPDFFMWWDGQKKMDNEMIAPYSYKGYQTHALFENLRLGFVAERDAKKVKPAAGAILVITNANDPAVNYEVVAEFEQLWLEHGEEFLSTFQFDKSLGLPHDIITTTHPQAQINVVYPRLLEIIK